MGQVEAGAESCLCYKVFLKDHANLWEGKNLSSS
jgi:hypothetical protein